MFFCLFVKFSFFVPYEKSCGQTVESLKPETCWLLSVIATHPLQGWLFNLKRLQLFPRSRLSQTFLTKVIPLSFAVCCAEVRGDERKAYSSVGAAPQQPWIHQVWKPACVHNSLTAGDSRYFCCSFFINSQWFLFELSQNPFNQCLSINSLRILDRHFISQRLSIVIIMCGRIECSRQWLRSLVEAQPSH